jgi:hypothetical protein
MRDVFDSWRRRPGILDWLRSRRARPEPAWEPTNRNALHQWWAKRRLRYLVSNGFSKNRATRRREASLRRRTRHAV